MALSYSDLRLVRVAATRDGISGVIYSDFCPPLGQIRPILAFVGRFRVKNPTRGRKKLQNGAVTFNFEPFSTPNEPNTIFGSVSNF